MAKKILIVLLMIGGVAYGPISGGDAPHRSVLSSYELKAPSETLLARVAERFEVAHRDGDRYQIIVPRSQAADFAAMAGPAARLLEKDISATIREELRSYRSSRFADQPRYHNLTEVHGWMQGLEVMYPKIVKAIVYGTSAEGRALMALRLSADVSLPETKPALMITAATHGDEVITTEVLMELVNRLIAGYGSDARLTKMVNDRDLYFIPVVNPDGFVDADRYDSGRDPNRSYPYPGDESIKPTASIAGLVSFFASRNIIGSIDFHAYGELVMYPWAYTRTAVDPRVEPSFKALASHMSEANGYTFGPVSRVLYSAPGSSADFYFWKKGSLSLAIEIGRRKAPPPAQIPGYVTSQVESTWRFIESFR